MRPISVVNSRTNEKQSGTRKQYEDVGPRNNQYLGSSVAMVLSGPRLLMMLKLIHYNHSSFKKCQQVPSYDSIPGKLTLGSLHEDTVIVSSIMGNDSTVTGKEIILMVWKDFGDMKRSSHQKEVFVERDYLST
jgi:hypothetical protein